ncbi:MAG: energy-coupling factor ABC transporter permease [Alphaproteobacteria bacterium]|nr:energy-coupling factor ABC transporter permease [Alphaproteobacteria bacterium]
MHMADALISPCVGGTMLAVSAGLLGYSLRQTRTENTGQAAALSGVLGAFVFAVQMINFTIPGTGSSGHLGGALLLAILLKPFRAFITMAAILLLQALLFADGGLLAYGCNVFNMSFFACFIAYPLIYQPLVRSGETSKKILAASLFAGIIGTELGAFAVVLETTCSGIVQLPFKTFAALMLPIHLVIGLAEGLATGSILAFLREQKPDLFSSAQTAGPKAYLGLGAAALFISGGLSLAASDLPDGLEWSVFKIAGAAFELPASLQAPFTDYTLAESTALAGIAGVILTALFVFAIMRLLHKRKASSV